MTDEEAENLDVEKLVTYGGRVEKNAAASNWIYGNASTSGPRCDEKRPDKPVVLPLAPQTPTDSQQTSFETDQGTPDTPCPRTGSSTVPNFNTKELGISFKLTKGMTPTSEVMIPVTRLDSPEDVSPSDTQHAAKFSTRIKEHVSSTTRKLVNKTSSLNLRKAVATSSPSVDQAGPAHLQLGSGRTRAESGGTMKSRSSSGPSLPTPTPKLRLPKVDEYEAAKAKDLTSPIPLLSQMSARARARTLSDKVPTFDKWFGEDDMADKSRQEAQSPVETADNCHPSPTGSSLSLVSLTTFIRESRMSSMPDMKTGDAEATEQAEKKKGRAENLLKALVGKKKD